MKIESHSCEGDCLLCRQGVPRVTAASAPLVDGFFTYVSDWGDAGHRWPENGCVMDRIVYPRFALSFTRRRGLEEVDHVLDVIAAPTAADALVIFNVRHKLDGAYWMRTVDCMCAMPFDVDAPACYAATNCPKESWDERRKAVAYHREKCAAYCQCYCHDGSDETNVEVPPRPRS